MASTPEPPTLHSEPGAHRDRVRPACPMPLALRWLALALLVPALTTIAHALRTLEASQPLPLSLELAAYASTLLLAAALLYWLGRYFAWSAQWASALALASGIELASVHVVNLYEAAPAFIPTVVAFIAFASFVYLLMENHYRDRRAGALVMLVLAFAVATHVHRAAADLDVRDTGFIRTYGTLVATVGAALGYSLLAAGGAFALQTLVKRATEAGSQLTSWMVCANRSGALLLAAAALLWELCVAPGRGLRVFMTPVEPWVILVLLLYAGHLLLARWLRPPARVTARWAVIVFTASVGFLTTAIAADPSWLLD
ncbi:MAG TPA: hypothetical protein VFB54_04320 [Burkholderiales bacterium]|nr:hypothetical protein [Burkholderiales bacterium]